MLDGAGSGGHQSPHPSSRTGLAERPSGPATAGLCPHGHPPLSPANKKRAHPLFLGPRWCSRVGAPCPPSLPLPPVLLPWPRPSNGGGKSPRPPPGHRLPEHFPCGRGPDRGWPRPPRGLQRGAARAARHGARYSRRWSPAE